MADSPLTRLVGLAGRRSLGRGRALVLPRCRSVHTFGMRFAVDLVWLDDGEPVRIDRGVRPGRVRSCRAADAVVEANAGEGNAVVAALRRARPARPGESPTPWGPAAGGETPDERLPLPELGPGLSPGKWDRR